MSKIINCDRCGVICDKHDVNEVRVRDKFDLCDDCYTIFKKWLIVKETESLVTKGYDEVGGAALPKEAKGAFGELDFSSGLGSLNDLGFDGNKDKKGLDFDLGFGKKKKDKNGK